ncbi:hypothetical protein KY285_007531 [Solanum tuberosum]|nr:hypothetical protein KY285_007531 [Solanum tuberosum]
MGFWSGFCWLVVWRSENWWSGGHLLVVLAWVMEILAWREWCLRAVSGRFHGCLNDSDDGLKLAGNGEERSCCRQWKVEENGWSFGGCFGSVSPENGENEWRLPELDLGF